jgi:hypothetical protein
MTYLPSLGQTMGGAGIGVHFMIIAVRTLKVFDSATTCRDTSRSLAVPVRPYNAGTLNCYAHSYSYNSSTKYGVCPQGRFPLLGNTVRHGLRQMSGLRLYESDLRS